ncbi:hypothetical protein [Faecalicatena contorta]|uniref:hypothetical protein n=1 Tax=Faecalicatena contorta TaxID=39482 RepID=UPI001F445D75|nr:hypothetical protein [Faecalicatena contorta]MCF2554414.1 hypothetical protein [Faecalicatena contorta]
MRNAVPKSNDKNMTEEQEKKFFKFIFEDDLYFYEEFTIHLTDNQQEKFFEENPEFMSEFPVSRDKMYLLKNKTFRDTLRKIKRYEGGK